MAAIRRGEDLWEVTATRITVAPGRHDAWPIFENNDLPGILSARGARRLLGEHGVLPGKRIVVHGPPLAEDFAADLQAQGAAIVATGKVEACKGSTAVAKARIGGAWVECDTVVCNLPGTPRVELFQQAGCELAFDADGFLAPVRDHAGTTSRSHIVAALSSPPRVDAGPSPRTRGAA